MAATRSRHAALRLAASAALPRAALPRAAARLALHTPPQPRWLSGASGGGGEPSSGSYNPPEHEGRIVELQRTMASLYHSGRYADALEAGEECHALALKAFGATHPATASVSNNLALMHKSLGDADRAAALYKEALDCYREVLGEAHASTATAACNLALLHRDSMDEARLVEARRLLEGVLETRKQLLGESHLEVAATMGHLASVVNKLDGAEGRRRAISLLEGALAATAPGGEQRADVLRANLLNSLGLMHKQAGTNSVAEALYTSAAELRDKWLGASHPHAIASQHNLAELARAAGDERKAQRIQREILARLGEAGGEAGPGEEPPAAQ